ncbi:MAG: hypothetical protein AAGA93_23610 [Actinomycetota bacterium]
MGVGDVRAVLLDSGGVLIGPVTDVITSPDLRGVLTLIGGA